jgi:hypothetical protein
LPGRRYFSTLVGKIHQKSIVKAEERLKQAQSVALTSDTWTSINNESFITVTSHFLNAAGHLEEIALHNKPFSVSHTGEYLSKYLKPEAVNWGIQDKITAIVTDNAANITNAVSLTNSQSVRCAAHTLQLCVKDALESDAKIEPLLSKCRAIVGHSKRSSHDLQKFKSHQQSHSRCQNEIDLKVLHDGKAR